MQTYRWSPLVAAALLELNPAYLEQRIAAADEAIRDRLADSDSLELDEQLRLRDAQNVIGDLKRTIH
jgi:hypothetical protein